MFPAPLYVKRTRNEEVDRTGGQQLKLQNSLSWAKHEKSLFRPTPCFKERTFHNSALRAEVCTDLIPARICKKRKQSEVMQPTTDVTRVTTDATISIRIAYDQVHDEMIYLCFILEEKRNLRAPTVSVKTK